MNQAIFADSFLFSFFFPFFLFGALEKISACVTSLMATVRKSKGRQRVEMTKMTKERNLQVTFSKRRSGLFKKASELCTLCGVEVAIIVFSPGKKIYSFGHPCVESIIDRLLTRNPLPNSNALQLFEAHRSANVRDLNMQLTQVLNQLEMAKKRGDALKQMRKASQVECWWEAPVEELGYEQLEILKASLENLKKNVALHMVDNLMIEASSTPTFYAPTATPVGFGDPRTFDFGYGVGGRLF